jgi:hypothetical protein
MTCLRTTYNGESGNTGRKTEGLMPRLAAVMLSGLGRRQKILVCAQPIVIDDHDGYDLFRRWSYVTGAG